MRKVKFVLSAIVVSLGAVSSLALMAMPGSNGAIKAGCNCSCYACRAGEHNACPNNCNS